MASRATRLNPGPLDDTTMTRIRPAILVALLCLALDAMGCSCIQTSDSFVVSELDVIVRARILSASLVMTNDDGSAAYSVTGDTTQHEGSIQRIVVLKVDEVFQGDVAPITVLVTGLGAGDCGYVFEEGHEYLIFATPASKHQQKTLAGATNALTTSICSDTRPTEKASDWLTFLLKRSPSKRPLWVSLGD
jgi:hypothetical protein